jgi:hypothetical protein
MAAINYVPGSAEPAQFDDIPAGEYLVMIVSSDKKDTSDRTGQFIALEHQIMEGQYKGRKLFNNLNLWNRSDAAVKIAEGTLESICRAQSRIEAVGDTVELHNIPMIAKVAYNTTRKNNKTGGVDELKEGQRNSITAYKKYEGDAGQFQPAVAVAFAQPVASTQQHTAATATTGAAVAAAPWS